MTKEKVSDRMSREVISLGREDRVSPASTGKSSLRWSEKGNRRGGAQEGAKQSGGNSE